MSRKQHNDLDTEELLKLADLGVVNTVTPDMIDRLKYDVSYFLSNLNIAAGKNAVSKKALYSLYLKWSHRPVDKQMFTLQVNTYLPNDSQYLYINLNAVDFEVKILELLEPKKDKRKSKHYKQHFEAFLNKYEIKKGKYWIESFQLFYLYDKWTYERKTTHQLSSKTFTSICKLYFENKITRNSVERFRVDISILKHLPIEKQQAIRTARENKNERKKAVRKKDKAKEERATKETKDETIEQTLSGFESVGES